MIKYLRWVGMFTFCLILLAACSLSPRQFDLSQHTEKELYQFAQDDLRTGYFLDAIDVLQAMEKHYPFGEYSISAQLSLIYAYYGVDELAAASATADRFIRLHPQYRHVDYAFYMKGLISFPEAKSFLQTYMNVDLSKRDISEAKIAFNHFSTLVKRFPSSEYTPDALKRMEFLRNLLARHEIHVANYYFERKAYLAATNRGRHVLENFQTTPAIPDALAVMAQGYHEMGMDNLSKKSIQALRTNYPNHPTLTSDGSFNFNYNTHKPNSWLNIATLGLINSTKPPGFNTSQLYHSTSAIKPSHKEAAPVK
ncbi:competence protein ComL [Candidatus Endobugula sertula]|uniref:Outer membrane protein assembly factor BamD n=1 Tax=Candidatus Endobugula sertula TaxID=62101 RepID=A0A1D2QTQ6_9GAMM|nr:competence protein ComL [Candidatus Endobugula sertula]